ncbi:MAG: hypothetical protein QOE54_1546 [Streptosporangiaceae bacterium]|jgi:uncharacterized membrane protein|nr:hypothetical protein [Streptosporangiaceae bacterium]MDX6429180.1 hypothetical protein [Streptosporangiaceae bacterium]
MTGAKDPRLGLRHELLVFSQGRQQLQDRVADKITSFAGSMPFIYLHVIWFTAWIIANVAGWTFDPFPFGLLTLVVSLEAIFLSTFVMLSQNREAARSDIRAEIDFETNVLSEVWLEALAEKLGIDVTDVHATARNRMVQAKARQEEAIRNPADAHPSA